jgi:predicted AAA+ superfamily ATPase
MALTNQDRVGRALDLTRDGLAVFVEQEFKNIHGDQALHQAEQFISDRHYKPGTPFSKWDAQLILRVMWECWRPVFSKVLGRAERTLVSELTDVRNDWAHQKKFSTDDAYRALDSAERLLTAVSAGQAAEVAKMKQDLLRLRYAKEVQNEKRKSVGTTIESQVTNQLTAWRDVVKPHQDVANGRYQQAEFAADLWQVHVGEGEAEYRDPSEFFRRTFLTESLKRLLIGGVRRLTSGGGDPVVQLQTNFGGGKTHSMLALYHLFSGAQPEQMSGADAILAEAGTKKLPKAKRVVLVGNKISPGNPALKADGTVVHTLWGELAYQLGGKEAYERVRLDDERATSPGDALRELFNQYGPCLILIDEWVAYARMLHEDSNLPGGDFETQFTFAQLLTESAKAAKNCLLVVSLPASDTAVSPHSQADDVEVGGQRGREALERLRNVIGRVEAAWQPASAEEGFEIVRRRLFEPISEDVQFKSRNIVARAFSDLYRNQAQEFPDECKETEYRERIEAAYPIHPEVFDRLYTDWSTLVKFQRTRGVLRLMASVIYQLWSSNDRNPLIMPANIPLNDPQVSFELKRYLSDQWGPIIEKDIDGASSLPKRIDDEVPNLGKHMATRRVARTLYLGSAPLKSANRGLEDRGIKLGCVMPGESPAVFGDALRRLASKATYLYADGERYWYDTQPTVTKVADDRAGQLEREPDKVAQEIERRVREDLKRKGDFVGVHPLPQGSQDVPDDTGCRLVVLGVDHPYGKEAGSPAEKEAQTILENRGTAPRLMRNTLLFLAPDRTRLPELDEATRRYLAWASVLAEKDALDLSPHQVKQAETQFKSADSAVSLRIPETYQWLLIPTQANPQSPMTWDQIRLTGQEALAERASKKIRNDQLYTAYATTVLRMDMNRVPLWRGNHVAITQLVEDFGRYLYLPRLKSTEILLQAIRDGGPTTRWELDSFAFAESYDDERQRYRGLRAGAGFPVPDADAPGLLVKSEVAAEQLKAERNAAADEPRPTDPGPGASGPDGPPPPTTGGRDPTPTLPAATPHGPRGRGPQSASTAASSSTRPEWAATQARSATRSSPTSPASSARRSA